MEKYIELLSHIHDVIVYFKMKFKLTKSSEKLTITTRLVPHFHKRKLVYNRKCHSMSNISDPKEKNLNMAVCYLHIFILEAGVNLFLKNRL